MSLVQDLNSNGVADAGEPVVQSVFTAANGGYSFSGVVSGYYVVHETDLASYISTGDTQPPNDNQIGLFLAPGAVTNGNDFFDYFVGQPITNNPPVAVPDFTNTLQNVAVTIAPLLNDNSPGGYALAITNVAATNGVAAIVRGTNVLFTPTANFSGTATVGYTITNANGASSAVITITVVPVADLAIGKKAPASVFAASNLIYTISVTNFGPSSAAGVVVTDTLPAGVTFVGASGNFVTNGGVVSWSLGTLTNSQVTNLALTVAAPASGTLTNIAEREFADG